MRATSSIAGREPMPARERLCEVRGQLRNSAPGVPRATPRPIRAAHRSSAQQIALLLQHVQTLPNSASPDRSWSSRYSTSPRLTRTSARRRSSPARSNAAAPPGNGSSPGSDATPRALRSGLRPHQPDHREALNTVSALRSLCRRGIAVDRAGPGRRDGEAWMPSSCPARSRTEPAPGEACPPPPNRPANSSRSPSFNPTDARPGTRRATAAIWVFRVERAR